MRHLYPLRSVLYALGALLLSSCATTPSLYGWGNYEATSYAVAKTPSEQNLQRLIQVYEELITHPKGTRQLPPPGICAEYGYLLIKQGKPEEGRKLLEELCGVPVLGVVPYLTDVHIEEEDSVALSRRAFSSQQGKVNIAVVLLRYISNYTDFARLEQDERIHLFYTNNVEELQSADIIIVPGSKSTLSDLYELRRNGVAQAIVRAHRAGKTILGICGGYQILGQEVIDPQGVEGELQRLPGLGLLPITTEMAAEKVTTQASFTLLDDPTPCTGYEIHMGQSRIIEGFDPSPLVRMTDGREEGYLAGTHCMGTYLHGILDNAVFVDYLLRPFADRIQDTGAGWDYEAFKQEQYDRLADHLREHVDLERIYQIMCV